MPAERLPDHPLYPVYLSPDQQTEQYADTPARCVELEFAGWRRVREPRPVQQDWAEPQAAPSVTPQGAARGKKPAASEPNS